MLLSVPRLWFEQLLFGSFAQKVGRMQEVLPDKPEKLHISFSLPYSNTLSNYPKLFRAVSYFRAWSSFISPLIWIKILSLTKVHEKNAADAWPNLS